MFLFMCSLAENQCDQIWQNFATLAKFKNIWQLYKGLICIWQTFKLTLENSVCFWANLCCCKWPNIEHTC